MISHVPGSFFWNSCRTMLNFHLRYLNIPSTSMWYELLVLVSHWNSYLTYHFICNLFKAHQLFCEAIKWILCLCISIKNCRRKNATHARENILSSILSPFFHSANAKLPNVLSPTSTNLNRLWSNWLCTVWPTWGHIDYMQWREVSQSRRHPHGW